MAISPTVNAHMQQAQGQSQSAEQLFNKQFTSQAYNTFQAKFPSLINSLITLKVLASDMDEGSAFGVFVLKRGADVVFIPVVMSDGIITSCEMVYDKNADQFSALTETTLKGLKAAIDYSDPTLLGKKAPYIEDTRALFHNMTRPPASSNVILAGERGGVAALPNRCKEVLAKYLEQENPHLLGKISEFYDVTELATKLAASTETKQAEEAHLPSFLRLEELSKEAAASLAREEREAILRDGYLIKDAGDGDALHVSPTDSLTGDVESMLRLTTYPDMSGIVDSGESGHCFARSLAERIKTATVFTGKLLQVCSEGIKFEPVLLCGRDVIAGDTYKELSSGESVLVSDVTRADGDSDSLLNDYSIIFTCDNFMDKMRSQENLSRFAHLHVFVPARSGWQFIDLENAWYGEGATCRVVEDGGDTCITIGSRRSTLIITPRIKRGYVVDGCNILVPLDARFMLSSSRDVRPLPHVSTMDNLLAILSALGSRITVVDNGAGLSLTDSCSKKTASFRTASDAASWLHDTYGMSGEQVRTVLSNKHCHVFSKTAFSDAYAGEQSQMPISYAQGSMEQPVDSFDPSMLDAWADLGDEELMDTGILAAFAHDMDIKGLLVDYLPDFLQAQDRLGRIILSMSSQKSKLEDFYGSEKYSTLMGSCRKIFQVLGDLVSHLKSYIHMH